MGLLGGRISWFLHPGLWPCQPSRVKAWAGLLAQRRYVPLGFQAPPTTLLWGPGSYMWVVVTLAGVAKDGDRAVTQIADVQFTASGC